MPFWLEANTFQPIKMLEEIVLNLGLKILIGPAQASFVYFHPSPNTMTNIVQNLTKKA